MKYTKQIVIIATSLVFVACENPADATTDAKVGDTQEVATAEAGSVTYTFTDASVINFVGSKITGSHEGGFKEFEGSFSVKDGTPTGGSFTIDMNSTWSDNDKLTGHLKSPDFFDVAAFGESKFEVTSFSKTSETTYDVSGNLTMHGETKNITFPAEVSQSETEVKLNSKFDIKRKDWGIVYAGKPDDLIRNEVVIELDLTAVPKN